MDSVDIALRPVSPCSVRSTNSAEDWLSGGARSPNVAFILSSVELTPSKPAPVIFPAT